MSCLWCCGQPLDSQSMCKSCGSCPGCGVAQVPQPDPVMQWYWRGRLLGLLRSRQQSGSAGAPSALPALIASVEAAITEAQRSAAAVVAEAARRVCSRAFGPAAQHDAVDSLLSRYLLAFPDQVPSHISAAQLLQWSWSAMLPAEARHLVSGYTRWCPSCGARQPAVPGARAWKCVDCSALWLRAEPEGGGVVS